MEHDSSWQIKSEEMVFHIVKKHQTNNCALNEKPWWMGNSTGAFSVKLPYHIMRTKRESREGMSYIWIKGLPFKKISSCGE